MSEKKFSKKHFKSSPRHTIPSPEKKDFKKLAQTKPDKHRRCRYIDPNTDKRCALKLGS